jgi:hypothetical protein
MIAHSRTLPWLLLLVVSATLPACRTYGGYGSEEATHATIAQVIGTFEEELAGARNELPLLQRAAGDRPDLQPFVAQFERAIEHHTMLLDEHRALYADLKVKTGPIGRLTTSYRDLNGVLGAILSEQREVQIAYEQLAMDVRAAVFGSAFQAEAPAEIGRYQAAPPYYERLRYAMERARLDLDASVTG